MDMQYWHGAWAFSLDMFFTLDMHVGHASWTCSKDMQHGHAVWTSSMIFGTDKQQWHAAWKCIINMQHGQVAWTSSVDMQCRHAAFTSSLDMHVSISNTCSMDMQHGNKRGHEEWTCIMDIHHRHGCAYNISRAKELLKKVGSHFFKNLLIQRTYT